MAPINFAICAALFAASAIAQSSSSCSATLTASYPAPSLAAGYTATLVANNLTRPRSIHFDSAGKLLVVEAGRGITALTLTDGGGSCLSVATRRSIVADTNLNHGIELSPDGKTLYGSTSDVVYSWVYDAAAGTTSNRRTLVTGMQNSDHTTRTLLLSRKVNGTLLVSRGSTSNNDPGAADINSARSQIRSFDLNDLSDTSSLDFASTGTILGWGLRNSVGVAEDPNTGGIFSVENSVDNLERNGQDVHENNPGEELNFHGFLNGTRYSGQGQNYGYPTCFAAWNVSEIPDNGALQVGSQFAIGTQNSTVNDDICANDRIAPRLTFPAHWAPLDIKFNTKGDTAWITSHGSWNRDAPDGYLLFTVGFSNGMPTAAANSTTAVIPIMRNQDNSRCPDDCFRPVGLAWDSTGRLFMTSDSTGEIYVVTTPATPPASPSPSPTRSAAVIRARLGLWLFVFAVTGTLGNVLV
ncbi:hypothetical protein Vi05172_g11119 [Venturia inaequalis]|nr:hypothetical protein Vi05172_g11119 [Venturia inaequalis]